MLFAGHGGSVPDSTGDEEDKKDETMVPVDYAKAGQIKDDDILAMVRRQTKPSADRCFLSRTRPLPTTAAVARTWYAVVVPPCVVLVEFCRLPAVRSACEIAWHGWD